MGKEQETHVNGADELAQQGDLEQPKPSEQSKPSDPPKQPKKKTREERIETAFVDAVRDAGGLALKFTSQTMNGVPDRLVLFKLGKCAFVEVKAPGKQMRPLQRKRRKQLEGLGFPVFCVDDFAQIKPVIQALKEWKPGEPFPTGVGAVIPEIKDVVLPGEAVPLGEESTDPIQSAAPVSPAALDPKEVLPHEVHTP